MRYGALRVLLERLLKTDDRLFVVVSVGLFFAAVLAFALTGCHFRSCAPTKITEIVNLVKKS